MSLWEKFTSEIKKDISYQDFNTWISPLHSHQSETLLSVFAPNQFVLDHFKKQHLEHLRRHIKQGDLPALKINIKIGSRHTDNTAPPKKLLAASVPVQAKTFYLLKKEFTFDSFVEGKSNELAKAAAQQTTDNPGTVFNPLFIYGATGLGKTHLMHAVGNAMMEKNPEMRIVSVSSEKYVRDMVKALKENAMDDFKEAYRSADILLIDDIQFFAGKVQTQEEFFHTFNHLIDNHKQIILTCDRYPKEIKRLEERLKSRFESGLSVSIDPPELETRVAILLSKAEQKNIVLPQEVAFFIAKRIHSNVRELEGALRRVIAMSRLRHAPITLDFAKESLRDLLAIQERLTTIKNIQETVAEYYKIRLSDLSAKGRSRSIVRPRQMAMMLAKELTNHSLPEIGEAFGGRDHTTVIHACKKIIALRATDNLIHEDHRILSRTLTI